MKIEPAKFEKMLRMLMLPKNKPLIPVVQLLFGENGVECRQMDSGMVIAVIANFQKKYFREYEASGEVKITDTIFNIIRKKFEGDEVIEVEFGDKVTLKGKIDKYTEPATTVEVNAIEEDKIKRVGGVAIPSKAKPVKTYVIDVAYLKDIEAEKIIFEYGDKLIVKVKDTGEFERTIPFSRSEGDGSGSAIVAGEYLTPIIKNLSGEVFLIFTNGPANITQINEAEGYSVSYNISTMVE